MRVACSSVVCLLGSLAFALPQTIEVDVDLVTLFVTVHDSRGVYVPGLRAEDFRLFEDDELQRIEVFEEGDNVESSLGILIDNSGSSAGILDSIRSGVNEFAGGLGADDEVFVMSFGTEARVIHDFGDSPRDLSRTLDGLSSWGTSVFFDALDAGIRKLESASGTRKALIVLTDGGDNRSKVVYRDVVRAAESGMVMLYFIGMGPPVLVDTYTLDGLASMTGGRVVLMSGDDSPSDALEAIREDLSRQYYLAYYSSAGPGYHAIRVEMSETDYSVRAREGYLVQAD